VAAVGRARAARKRHGDRLDLFVLDCSFGSRQQHEREHRASRARQPGDGERAPEPVGSATGSPAPPSSALAIWRVEIVERIASPSDPPTCWVVLSRPEASPESSGATPVVAAIVAGTNA
jgi:hypothetical protein